VFIFLADERKVPGAGTTADAGNKRGPRNLTQPCAYPYSSLKLPIGDFTVCSMPPIAQIVQFDLLEHLVLSVLAVQ
jgi:hypothetical protein